MADAIIRLGLDDSNFTSGIQSAQAEIDKFNRKEGVTNSKIFNLNRNLNEAKRNFLSAAYNYKKLGDEGRKTDAGRKLLDIKEKAAATIRELQATKNELQELTRVSNQTSMSTSMPSSKNGLMGGNILQSLTSQFGGGGEIVGNFASALGGELSIGAAAATAGLAAAGIAVSKFVDVSKEAIQKSSEFGKALSELGAITGLHGNALQDLRGQIQDLAKETNTSVVDVTNGMAKIGGAMPQLLKDTDGLGEMFKQSSTLAKAGLMSQENAVEALTTIMGQFSHGVGDASKDVDILANASQSGSAEISDLAATIKVAGVAASNGGLSLQQTAAMAEVLGDKALKGSEAGTQLRNIFSKFSAEGIKDADTIMQTLAQHAGDTAWMVKQFGVDSANAAAMLAEGGGRYKELLSAMEETGTATEMASENFNNL